MDGEPGGLFFSCLKGNIPSPYIQGQVLERARLTSCSAEIVHH